MNSQRRLRLSRLSSCSLAAGALLALVAGCSPASTGASAAPTSESAGPSIGHTTAATSGRVGAARIVAHYDIPQNEVSNLQVWSHYLSFSSAGANTAGNHTPNQITVVDLNSGRSRIVARSHYPHGQSDESAGVGDYIAWTDQQEMQTDDDSTTAWQIHLTNLATGKDRVIAASTRPERVVPSIAADSGHVVWTQLNKAQNAGDVHSYDIFTGANRTLVSGVGPSSTTVTGGYAVYDTATSSSGADVFEVPVNGGHPLQLTHNGKAALPRARAGRIAWQEPNQGDPTSLWTVQTGGRGKPVKAVDGATLGNAVPGSDFLAYWGAATQDLKITMLDPAGHPTSTFTLSKGDVAVPPRIASDAHRVTWGEYLSGGGNTKPDGPQIIRIYVATLA